MSLRSTDIMDRDPRDLYVLQTDLFRCFVRVEFKDDEHSIHWQFSGVDAALEWIDRHGRAMWLRCFRRPKQR